MKQTARRREITLAEYRALVHELAHHNPSYAIAMDLGWYAGLRIGEITKLRWHHVGTLDAVTRRLTLPAEITKNRQERTLPITDVLARRLIYHRGEGKLIANTPSDQDPVIHRLTSYDPLSTRVLQRAYRSAAAKIGAGIITPHSLRHTFATRLLRVSSTRLVQLALGHKSISTTELYTHPTIEEIELAMVKAALED